MVKIRLVKQTLLLLLVTLSFSLISAEQNATCQSIGYQLPYFRMVPLFLGKTMVKDKSTWTINNLMGSCFNRIQINTDYTYLIGDFSRVTVDITINA